MKTLRYPVLVLGLLSALVAADPAPAYKPESRTTWEVFTSKVSQVLSFSEGELEYRAYIVQWRGHKVVVEDRVGEKAYAVGEEIRCRMSSFQNHPGEADKALMSFTTVASAARSDQELQAVTNEVKARRLKRQEANEKQSTQ